MTHSYMLCEMTSLPESQRAKRTFVISLIGVDLDVVLQGCPLGERLFTSFALVALISGVCTLVKLQSGELPEALATEATLIIALSGVRECVLLATAVSRKELLAVRAFQRFLASVHQQVRFQCTLCHKTFIAQVAENCPLVQVSGVYVIHQLRLLIEHFTAVAAFVRQSSCVQS